MSVNLAKIRPDDSFPNVLWLRHVSSESVMLFDLNHGMGTLKRFFPKVLLLIFGDCCLQETRSCNKGFELTHFYVWFCGFQRKISLLGSLSN